MLDFELVHSSPVTLISLQGRFDSSGASVFEQHFAQNNSLFPILDFSKVIFLSSAGIRVLLQNEKLLRKKNGRIILCGVSENIKQVLEITGLLNVFTYANTVDEAKDLSLTLQDASGSGISQTINNIKYSVKHFKGAVSKGEIWIPEEQDKHGLMAANMDEFKYAFGTGGLGTTREQVKDSEGKIFLTKNLIGIIQQNGYSDYLFSHNPSDSYFFLRSAINVSGRPDILIGSDTGGIAFGDLIKNSLSILSDKTESPVPAAFFILIADIGESAGMISIGVATDRIAPEAVRFFEQEDPIFIDEQISFSSSGIKLQNSPGSAGGDDVDDSMNDLLIEDNISDIFIPAKDMNVGAFRIWLFIPEFRNAREIRTKICFDDFVDIKDEFEVITRKIYSDCSSITLKQLHGGYSAKTFQVFGYDKKGIRILPTVLKLAKRGTVRREVVNYEENVKRYILNNSTSVMGNYYYGDFGGVRYNFVGITGPDSRIGWLTDLYRTKTSDELLPLFDRIFTDILRPWYGQPRLETFQAFKEHNPTTVFFPELFEQCEKELGISPDQEQIYFEELGRGIVNPYWFLKYGYKAREKKSQLWYKCICHGDLNMQNILLDEIKNVYIIDYSETSFRNAVADFARLEPIFKFEFPVISQGELKNLIQFEKGLLAVHKLDELPPFTYSGSDPFIKKAYKIICRLRQYADTVTLFETDLTPYLLAVLEWTYAVVCYQSVDRPVKKYSAISAALICEKIIHLENKN